MTSDTVAVHGTARYVAARFGRGSLVTEQDKLDNFMSSLVFQKENGVLFGGREPAMREDGAT